MLQAKWMQNIFHNFYFGVEMIPVERDASRVCMCN